MLRSICRRASGQRSLSRPFGTLTADDIEHFRTIVGDAGIVTDTDDLVGYNTDWMRKYKGSSRLAVRPASTEEVSAVLRHCHARSLAVVPQGGNTGLVGGSVPVHDEIVLSLSRMNAVRSFDPVAGILQCDAGCVLQSLDDAVGAHGYAMPLDLGAKGTCQIGGNVSTNAGGLRVVRYGSLRGSVLGLEVVLADGRVLDLMSALRKDNTGYGLAQAFIGAEGTLGVVTGVSILTPRRPNAVNVAFLACDSYEAVQRVFVRARAEVGETLSAFEFMDEAALAASAAATNVARPLDGDHPFYVLIETSGSVKEHDDAKVHAFLERAIDDGLVADGTLAESVGQVGSLWALREEASSALAAAGLVPFKYDVSLPLPDMYSLVDMTRERFSANPSVRVIGYGHLGDSNLHLNVGAPTADKDAVLETLEPWVYDTVASLKGSISAEHGIGQAKPHFLHLGNSPTAMEIMHSWKKAMDPRGILNPGKVLPPESTLHLE